MNNMKKLLSILAIALFAISCGDKSTTVVVYPQKVIKLDEVNLLTQKDAPMFAKAKSKCSFPAEYQHSLPDKFNLFFVNLSNASDYVKFQEVEERTRTYKVAAREWRVVVTNSSETQQVQLPRHSTELFLWGEETIDFSNKEEGKVEIGNPYAAVMLVDNNAVQSTPTLDGTQMEDVGEYFTLYTKPTQNQNLSFKNYRNKNENHQVGPFKANQVYRYMVCQEVGLEIEVDDI